MTCIQYMSNSSCKAQAKALVPGRRSFFLTYMQFMYICRRAGQCSEAEGLPIDPSVYDTSEPPSPTGHPGPDDEEQSCCAPGDKALKP